MGTMNRSADFQVGFGGVIIRKAELEVGAPIGGSWKASNCLAHALGP
jgi:hypothetical protein